MNIDDLTLFSIGDHKNFCSLKKSINSYIKYANNNVLVVNPQQCSEISNFSSELSINVLTLNKKYGYPMFGYAEADSFIDSLFEVILRPSLLIKTKYFIWSEPDAFFFNKIEIEEDDFDIVSPSFIHSTSKMKHGRWVFVDYFYLCKTTNDERYSIINEFFKDFKSLCDDNGINWDRAAANDLIFNFYPGSIVNTKKFQSLLLENQERIKIIIRGFFKLIEKHYSKYALDVKFSWDIILSLLMGLFLFKWISSKNIHAISNDVVNIQTENDLNNFLKSNTDVSFLHPIKLYYNK